MKKTILTVIAVIGYSFTSSAQCDAQSTQLINDCGSYCISVEIKLTGILSVDNANYESSGGTMRRKPTVRELLNLSHSIC